jgi:hypothetical protein
MKELTIEQKAKAYDEVVNKLKGFIMQGVDPLITRADVQDFFPELAESDDERIRNEIIQEREKGYGSDADDACILELQNVLTYIDSLQEEPVSEDLGEYLYELSKQFPEVSFAKLSRIGVRVAKWQKEHLRTVGNRTMSRAEKFISEHTRNCSNVFVNPQLGGTEENHPWLTPDQARRAVEIAREETIKEVCEWLDNHTMLSEKWYIEDLKKHLEGKV